MIPEMLRLADDASCPGCGHALTGCTPMVEGTRPKAGDFSLCTNCGALLEFQDAAGHVQFLPASLFKSLPLEIRKRLAHAQSEILKALKGGRL